MGRRKKKLSITQQLMQEVVATQKDRQHDLTRKQYIRDAKRFIQYCREVHDCRTLDECRSKIQIYVDFLKEKGYTASTIHTYASAVCSVFGIPLADIQKPTRHTSDYTRGRREEKAMPENKAIQDLLYFAERVAIRRSEYKHLTGRDWLYDEDGFFCVIVRRGKGGKCQYQRIFPQEDADKIKAMFEAVGPNGKLFPLELFQHSVNLHRFRSLQANRVYGHLVSRIHNDPSYAAELERQIRARYALLYRDKKTGQSKRFPEKEIRGEYVLRGKPRMRAIQMGLPVSYHKIALMYLSMFHLAHGRCDVTVESYLLQ